MQTRTQWAKPGLELGRKFEWLTNLRDERRKVPRISLQKNMPNVTSNLMGATQNHTLHIPGCFPSDAKKDVHNGGQGKKSSKDDIRWQGRSVTINALINGTKLCIRVSSSIHAQWVKRIRTEANLTPKTSQGAYNPCEMMLWLGIPASNSQFALEPRRTK